MVTLNVHRQHMHALGWDKMGDGLLNHCALSTHITQVWLVCAALLGINNLAMAQEPGMSSGSGDTLSACQDHPYSIYLSVHKVRKTRGLITVDLHNDNPEGWINSSGRVGRERADAKEGTTNICVPVETAGTYAIAVYHDKDADHEFDKNFLGIPSEPFGISNDPKIGLSAPPHEKAAFAVQGPATPVTVTLRGK